MMDTPREIGPVGRQLQELSRGSLTRGYQTAIAEVMIRVKQVMDARRITQKDLAEIMDVDPAFVSRKLNDPDNMTVRTFYRICNAVGLKPSLCAQPAGWHDEGQWQETSMDAALGAREGDGDGGKSAIAA